MFPVGLSPRLGRLRWRERGCSEKTLAEQKIGRRWRSKEQTVLPLPRSKFILLIPLIGLVTCQKDNITAAGDAVAGEVGMALNGVPIYNDYEGR